MKYTLEDIRGLTPKEAIFLFNGIQEEKINKYSREITLAGGDGDKWQEEQKSKQETANYHETDDYNEAREAILKNMQNKSQFSE